MAKMLGLGEDEPEPTPLDFKAVEPALPATLQLSDSGELEEVPPDLEPAAPPDEDDWYENLADGADEQKLTGIANDIIELVKDDISSREGWYKLLQRGLDLMGLTKSDLDDGPFPGSATVIHPVLTEAVVQFWARALPELFPSDGPAKGKVRGDYDEQKEEAAVRVQDHMNYQMTEEDKGYRRETSRMIWAVGAHGGAYRKTFRNTLKDTTQGIYVPAEHFIVPYNATDLDTAARFTHRMRKTPNEVRKAQARGEWRKVELMKPDAEEETEAETVKAEVEAKTPTGNEKDARHEIYETYIDLDLKGIDPMADDDGIELPYIVTLETGSSKILAIRRNWREHDEMREKRIYFTPYEFIPGFGFYPLGLFHLIGMLSESATGALRAILDGAATASLQGGFVTKDVAGKVGDDGQLVIEPGKYKVIDATAEELAKGVYTPPFKEPSATLFQTLGLLIDGARKLASVTEALTGEGDNTGPVGTTVALIEQGMKVFSTVHQGLHMSMRQELQIRFEINKEYAPADGYAYDVHGDEKEVYREDYMAHSTDIVPVSDPNIFSVTQRLAIAQSTYQLCQENPELYDKIEVHKRLHQAMRTPDYDDLLIDPADMVPLDPIAENQCLLTMKAIRVFPEQDHRAHLAVHLSFLQNPGFGGHPEVFELIQANAKAHIAQHLAALYAQYHVQMGVPAYVIDFAAQRPSEIGTPEQLGIAAMAAQVSQQLSGAPGLPPPPESTEQAEHEMKMRHTEEDHQQALKHKDDAHQQDMSQAAEKFGLDQRIAKVETAAEEQRKDETFAAEEARKELAEARAGERESVKAEREEGRKDAAVARDDARKTFGARQEDARKTASVMSEEERKAAAAAQKARQTEEGHQQKLRQGDETHIEQQRQRQEDHTLGEIERVLDKAQTIIDKAEGHQQELKHRDEDHKQASKQTEEKAKQALKQSDEKAKRDLKNAKPPKSK